MFPKVPQSSLGILRVSQLHVVNCGGDHWEVGQPRAYGFAFLVQGCCRIQHIQRRKAKRKGGPKGKECILYRKQGLMKG